jgi:hypothetical protein
VTALQSSTLPPGARAARSTSICSCPIAISRSSRWRRRAARRSLSKCRAEHGTVGDKQATSPATTVAKDAGAGTRHLLGHGRPSLRSNPKCSSYFRPCVASRGDDSVQTKLQQQLQRNWFDHLEQLIQVRPGRTVEFFCFSRARPWKGGRIDLSRLPIIRIFPHHQASISFTNVAPGMPIFLDKSWSSFLEKSL